MTAPAHETVLTGLYPVGYGMVLNGLVLVEEHDTLTEVFVNDDFGASAIVSSFVLDAKFRLQQGCAYHDGDF